MCTPDIPGIPWKDKSPVGIPVITGRPWDDGIPVGIPGRLWEGTPPVDGNCSLDKPGTARKPVPEGRGIPGICPPVPGNEEGPSVGPRF